MSLTVKQLKEILATMNDDAIVVNEQNQDFIHILANDNLRLSTAKPIGTCNRSGEYVYPSVIDGYSAFCPELDEDLYDIEWTPFVLDCPVCGSTDTRDDFDYPASMRCCEKCGSDWVKDSGEVTLNGREAI